MARSRWQRAGLGCGGVVVVLVAIFLALPTRKLVFPDHYDVVSIAAAPAYQDRLLLERARASPAVSAYPSPPLWQQTGSTCGPTSLANLFRSFGEDHVTVGDVLAGSGACSTGICFGGLTLDELAEVARRRHGYHVTLRRNLTLGEFRDHLVMISDPSRRYTINFDRGPLFGTGGGHHSPLGGYLADEDLVLVIDVNATFKPWMVKAERLFHAMDTMDGETKRGMLLIERE
jgi:hypothetical protein